MRLRPQVHFVAGAKKKVKGRERSPNNVWAEEALQESEKRYRRLFETAQDGILILDARDGQIIDVNPFLTDMLGYSLQDLQGKNQLRDEILNSANKILTKGKITKVYFTDFVVQ